MFTLYDGWGLHAKYLLTLASTDSLPDYHLTVEKLMAWVCGLDFYISAYIVRYCILEQNYDRACGICFIMVFILFLLRKTLNR